MTRLTAWRAVHPDLRSSRGFRWPWPGNEAVAPLPDGAEFTHRNPCPKFVGDGLCLAKTWRGAASGSIPAITCLLVEFAPADVLGEDDDKVRVSRCRVVDVFDAPALIRDGWCQGADLRGANLRGANLGGASGVVSAGPIGSEGRIAVAVAHPECIMVHADCWWDSADELRARIAPGGGHGWRWAAARHRAEYEAFLALAEARLGATTRAVAS